jgi:hypothetical protein
MSFWVKGLQSGVDSLALMTKLNLESDPGIKMADNLVGLAVHNSYHFGKIVVFCCDPKRRSE